MFEMVGDEGYSICPNVRFASFSSVFADEVNDVFRKAPAYERACALESLDTFADAKTVFCFCFSPK
jgi:hypothetical protein